jgi:triacylglycerol lipase
MPIVDIRIGRRTRGERATREKISVIPWKIISREDRFKANIVSNMMIPTTKNSRFVLALAIGLLGSLSSCSTTTRTQLVASTRTSECVVLLHGLNRSSRAMDKMAAALQAQGFSTANVDYPSQQGSVETLAPIAVGSGLDQCRNSGADRIHFVTHSMGGILFRYAHGVEPIPELGRVVMLGPPSQGSEVVDITRDWAVSEIFSGAAGKQLGTDEGDIPARLNAIDFELGIVAGTGSINPFMSAVLPDADDGKVTVERTKVEGMADFLVVTMSHRTLMKNNAVIQNTVAFLQTGQFLDAPRVN